MNYSFILTEASQIRQMSISACLILCLTSSYLKTMNTTTQGKWEYTWFVLYKIFLCYESLPVMDRKPLKFKWHLETLKTSMLTISIKSLSIVILILNMIILIHYLSIAFFDFSFLLHNKYVCMYVMCHLFWVPKLWRKPKTVENCWHIINKNIQFILNVWDYTVCNPSL